jgi:ribosomal-protein-alanine N-acetyltransferase
MIEPVLEPMREPDLDEVLAIERACFTTPWSRLNFLFDLHASDAHCLVARLDERIVGFVIGWFVLDELHIHNLAVHPEHRRRGLGGKLLRSLLGRARERGIRRAILELRVSNQLARKLYKKHGFKEVATRKDYYRQPIEDACLMVMALGTGSKDDPAGLEVQDGVVSKG